MRTPRTNRTFSIRRSWVLSYLAVLAVPLVVFILVSWNTSRALEDQLTESNTTLVDLMGKEIDGNLDYISRLINDILWNPLTATLMYQDDQRDGEVRYDMVRWSEALDTYASYDRFTDLFFVDLPRLDSVLMPRAFYGFDQFWQTYFQPAGWASRDLRSLLAQRHDGDSVPLDYIDGLGHRQSAVMVLKSLPPTASSPVAATVAVVVNLDTINQALHSAVKTSRSEIRILNAGGQVLSTTLQAPWGPQPALAPEVAIAAVQIGGEGYTVLQRRTQHFGWTVQLLVPDSVLKEKLLWVQLLFLGGLVVCLGLGGALTAFLLQRNYGPVHRLVASLPASDPATWKNGDEFDHIFQAVALAQQEKARALDQFERHKEPLREHLASRLLRGLNDQGLALEDSLAALEVTFATGAFTVLLVHSEVSEDQAALSRIRITRELETGLAPMATLLRSSAEGPLTFLINFTSSEPSLPALQDALTACGDRLDADHHIGIQCALGSVVQGTASLPTALDQAKTALEYRFVVGGSRPLTWDEIQAGKPAALYHYDLESEARLVTVLKAGDEQAALAIMEAIWAENTRADRPTLSPQAAQCLVWDLGTSLMKALAEAAGPDERFPGLLEQITTLAQAPQWDRVRSGMTAVVREACAIARERNLAHKTQMRSATNRQFADQVGTFLRNHYQDPNLNLTMVADAHSLTPAYLSRLFRENQDEGIFDFLNRIRIDHARVLLKDGEGNLQEVGTACGFVDVKTFIRTFRKVAGTTPGKYRESMHGPSVGPREKQ